MGSGEAMVRSAQAGVAKQENSRHARKSYAGGGGREEETLAEAAFAWEANKVERVARFNPGKGTEGYENTENGGNDGKGGGKDPGAGIERYLWEAREEGGAEAGEETESGDGGEPGGAGTDGDQEQRLTEPVNEQAGAGGAEGGMDSDVLAAVCDTGELEVSEICADNEEEQGCGGEEEAEGEVRVAGDLGMERYQFRVHFQLG